MIYDLCDVQNECTYKYTYNNGAKAITKDVLLDEYDFLWPKLRHMHIADCISKVFFPNICIFHSNRPHLGPTNPFILSLGR